MGSLGTLVCAVLGILAFVLITLGVSLDFGWFGAVTTIYGTTATEFFVYGVLAAGGAVGVNAADL
jgi:hypothetical protein